ncbi:MAG: pyridoxal-phosphate dependent enzyme [Planctomycetota bacterium]
MVSFSDVEEALERISPYIHQTPIVTCEALDDLVGTRLFLKCENFQKAGAFKFRGATNALALLSKSELERGVVTHSSGNHAGALARAAKIFGTKAYIVMPSNSTEIKKAAVKSYGGQVTECEPTLEARLAGAESIQKETGAVPIPPYNHPHIIAGQGTCALEMLKQVGDLDAVIAPVGGGGLMSGTCLATRQLRPKALIFGAEPSGADDAFQSKHSGTLIPQTNPQTMADGLRTSLGDLTWPFIRDEVDEILLADEDEIRDIMRFVWERAKIIIEPSCAVPIVGLIRRFAGVAKKPSKIGVIISGGNVDMEQLPWMKKI